ncbi:MAG: hypothetical protein LBF69_00875 [Prevotellaceae bacterium]|jgi:hypothetical protein|nr:hypothetical protein [Prevotellaceae bacterium]
MNKREAINRLKDLVQIAGPDRLRALFSKYHLKANLNVSGVITGVELHGKPFFADFAKMVADAQRTVVGFDTTTGQDLGIQAGPTSSIDDAPTGGGTDWNSIFGWVNTLFNTGINAYNAISGGGSSGSTTVVQPGANTPIIVQPNANSGSGSNTALWVVGGAVALILIVVVIFLAMKK